MKTCSSAVSLLFVKRTFTLLLCISLAVFTFDRCEEDIKERPYPRVKTLDVTDINEGGALFRAEVTNEANTLILDHGFAWGKNTTPDLERTDRISLGATEAATFGTRITSTLTTGQKYVVCAYIRTEKNIIYGKEVEFESLGSEGPDIDSISPTSVAWGDTVRIYGKNFSWINGTNRVFIGETEVPYIASSSDTLVKFLLPYTVKEKRNIVSVNLAGNVSRYINDTLIFLAPEIETITPSSVFWGDTVKIKMRNLALIPLSNYVSIYFGTAKIPYYFQKRSDEFKFVVPESYMAASGAVKMKLYDFSFEYATPLTMLSPRIDRISPVHGTWLTTVTIYGKFNLSAAATSVRFGTTLATIKSITRDSIKVAVPSTLVNTTSDVIYRYDTKSCTSPQQFVLDPPVIESVTPLSEAAGGEVTITGKNFLPNYTTVRFSNLTATVASVTNTQIKCYVPGNFIGYTTVTVTAGSQSSSFPSQLYIRNPKVISINPLSASPGDTITFECQHYNGLTTFLLSGNTFNFVSFSGNMVKVKVPGGTYTSGPIYAYMNRNGVESRLVSDISFSIKAPEITSFSPASGVYDTEVTLTGSGFSKVAAFNRISVDGKPAAIVSCSPSEIKFKMPLLPQGEYPVTLSICGHTVSSSVKFTNRSPWTKLPSIMSINNNVVLDFADEVYVGKMVSGTGLKLYKFDEASSAFVSGPTVTSQALYYEKPMIKGDIAYVFGMFNSSGLQFLSVSKTTMTQTNISKAPGTLSARMMLLDGDSVLYAGGGNLYYWTENYIREFWKYRPTTNTWVRLNDIPFYAFGNNSFTVNGKNYVSDLYKRVWEYDVINDTWILKSNYPGVSWDCLFNIVSGGKVYLGHDNSSDSQIYSFDPVANTWTPLINEVPVKRDHPIVFDLNNKIYFGGGNYDITDFWMYDPSQE